MASKELIRKAITMKAGEKYRLIVLEEDIINSAIDFDPTSELFKRLLNLSGQVVTLLCRAGNQWSTYEITNDTNNHHWYFNADCFVPLDVL